MSDMHRLSPAVIADLNDFIPDTAKAWIQGGRVKPNSWGVEVLALPMSLGSGWAGANYDRYVFSRTKPEGTHPGTWYVENAGGKNKICIFTGIDSHEAVRLYQGLVGRIHGAFPWGGAIIDLVYGIIIGTSGFKEDEDILFSRTIRNRTVMQMDREGELVIMDARRRGDQEGEAAADRFTRPIQAAG